MPLSGLSAIQSNVPGARNHGPSHFTELLDSAPDQIGIAPDLLGHADLQTTKKHYIQAVGMKAHLRLQEVIAARRRAAARGT